jgi:hypothetical protein
MLMKRNPLSQEWGNLTVRGENAKTLKINRLKIPGMLNLLPGKKDVKMKV